MTREFVFGTRDPATLLTPLAVEPDLSCGDDLRLDGVQMHYAVVEIAAAAARALVPPSLHPTTPGLVSLHMWKVQAGQLGPFTLAMLGVVTRTNYKPRHLVLTAFISTTQARAGLAARCGLPLRLAEVEQREYNDAVLSSIAVKGRTLLDVSTHQMQPVLGSAAALKIAPLLAPARIGGRGVLVQAETSYEFRTTRRGRPTIHSFEAGGLGLSDVQLAMPAMSAHAVADITLHPLRFSLDLARPAEQVASTRLRQAA